MIKFEKKSEPKSLGNAFEKAEIRLTYIGVLFTTVASTLLFLEILTRLKSGIINFNFYNIITELLFALIVCSISFSSLVYFTCRFGYWSRKIYSFEMHKEEVDNFFSRHQAPRVTYLIPSYKEELRVIRQTLLSAALQEYPNKYIVLLIDNPPNDQSI
jgi:cellulose synthase/poly-beta-1,6-N-acetylglucosamine synthase-like glycosyltransferase